MAPENSVSFFDMFSACRDDDSLRPILEKALVYDATVDRKNMRMRIRLGLPCPVPPVALRAAENAICDEFDLAGVEITPVYQDAPAPKKEKAAEKGAVIMGRAVKDKPVPMNSVTLESGRVTVQGEVFACDSRELTKSKAHILSFDISDGTSSLRVSKFMRDENAEKIVSSVKPGMYLTVQGDVGLDRYYKDITIDPRNIVEAKRETRADKADKKRVELHLHTTMSAMDALTDTKAVVKRAIAWGHPAIAITDHGVCQAFPDAMKAAGDKIKVLYGVEGYYTNDVDDRPAVYNVPGVTTADEFVAFDIETTGLDSYNDRITEIGAVLMRGGK